jgi:cytochrome c
MTWGRILVAVVTFVQPVGVIGYQDKRAEAALHGQKIFQQCIGCHSAETDERKVGPSLKGLFKKLELLNGAPVNERNIRLKIKAGGDGMPSYERTLSVKELDQLIGYLRTL